MKKAIFVAGAICMVSALVATSSAIVNNVREGSNSLEASINWRSFSSQDAHPRRDFERYHLNLPKKYEVVKRFDSTEDVKVVERDFTSERNDPYFEYRRENFAESRRAERLAQGWWRLFE